MCVCVCVCVCVCARVCSNYRNTKKWTRVKEMDLNTYFFKKCINSYSSYYFRQFRLLRVLASSLIGNAGSKRTGSMDVCFLWVLPGVKVQVSAIGWYLVQRSPTEYVYVCGCHWVWPGATLALCTSVSQPPCRGPVPGPGSNYTGPREVLLEFVILVFQEFFMNKYFIVEIFWGE